MKARMKTRVSSALTEVWEMKRAASEETKHLHGAAYFRHVHERVARIFPGVEYRPIKARPAAAVAERHARYGKRS